MAEEFKKYADLHGGTDAAAIRAAAENPSRDAAVIHALGSELEADERHVASDLEGDIEAGARANLQPPSSTAKTLVRNASFAVGLMNNFAVGVETFDGKVDDLNRRLNAAVQGRVLKNRKTDEDLSYNDIWGEEKRKLQPEYNAADDALETKADRVAGMFEAGATTENVERLARRGLIPLDQLGLWPQLHLTADDKYTVYSARLKSGMLTEEERRAFNEANPGLLERWMNEPHPDRDLQRAIISLALPVVDADAGESDASAMLRAIDGHTGQGDFLEAMERTQDVNSGLALLAGWATRTHVDLASDPTVNDAQGYLQHVVADTWDRRDDVFDYIKANEHDWDFTYTVPDGTHQIHHTDDGFSDGEQHNMFKAYANAILNTSQEDFGGSYTDLPEGLRKDAEQTFSSSMKASLGGAYWDYDEADDFRDLARLLVNGDAEPGEGLAKQLASSAVTSTANAEDFWAKQPGGDDVGPWDTGLTADILDLTSRNREATADLVAGVDVPPNYRSDFNATILDQPWDLENGDEAKAAKMYSWIHDDYASKDPQVHDAADRAFDKLSQDITSTKDDTFQHLMGEEGDSAARRNTLITREIVDAFSDHLGEFSAENGTTEASGSPLSEGDRIRLMTYMASDNIGDDPTTFDYDRGAGRLNAYVAAHQQDNINTWAHDPTSAGAFDLGDKNGRLQGMLDAALVNEAQERGLNDDEMEAERVRNLKIASGVAATLAGQVPIPGVGAGAGVGNTFVANLLTAEHMPEPPAELPADWQPDGSQVTRHNTLAMVDALVRADGDLKPSDLPPELQNPDGRSNAQVQGTADSFLANYFRTHEPHDDTVYTDFSNELHSTYKGFADHYNLGHADKDNKKDFLTQDDWGRL